MTRLTLLAAALALATPLLAFPPAVHAADDTLFAALGGLDGVTRLADGLVARATTDPRIAKFFDGVDQAHLRAQLAGQFCQLSGGPCTYKGPTMKVAHQDMDLRAADFNALVEDLQQAMDAQGIPFRVQGRLLALLAPMHRDIVNTH